MREIQTILKNMMTQLVSLFSFFAFSYFRIFISIIDVVGTLKEHRNRRYNRRSIPRAIQGLLNTTLRRRLSGFLAPPFIPPILICTITTTIFLLHLHPISQYIHMSTAMHYQHQRKANKGKRYTTSAHHHGDTAAIIGLFLFLCTYFMFYRMKTP